MEYFRRPPHGVGFEQFCSLVIRLLVWGGVFAVLYVLRSFFLLIFLTFVFGYIQMRGVNWLERFVPRRPFRVAFVAAVVLGILIAVGLFLVPRAKDQTLVFLSQLPQYLQRLDRELLELGARYPVIADLIPELRTGEAGSGVWQGSPLASLVQQLFGLGEGGDGQHKITQVVELVRGVSGSVVAIASAFLLSLLFSFLIVLDLPHLSASIVSLKHSKVGFIYEEVAESIQQFAHVLGRSLEAQFTIAVMNSLLTALGLLLLGLSKNMAFLTVIVFLCSFIPVLGVFISSVPICLIALQTSGLSIMMLAIIMITVIHLIEGYILNPRIYGSYMRINPVVVLVILTIGAKLFHVWGLILGVPICTYVFGHVIWREPKTSQLL